ncbi:MAG: ABC transporter ATP-binding protein [Chloroflexi bacterium]|nr:ABC transporter ATP-binding protein [Chloroflexota bacterium]
MTDIVIQASSLTRTFGRTVAVQGIELSVNRGEIFGLLGPDGAGKSTTLRLLSGLLTPDAGSVRVLGSDVIRQKASVNPNIAYVSEGFTLYESLSVKENLDFFARLRRVPGKEARARQRELLAFSRLEAFAGRRAEHLSGGMKKKLALCCALIHGPEVVFLDEPTTGIDPLSRRELWRILTTYRSRGVTICLSTPYMDEAEKCDRVALFHGGRIVGAGRPEDLKEQVPGESLELSLAAPWRALALLKDRPGIRGGQVLGNTVRLAVDRAAERIPDLEGALAGNGIKLDNCRTVPFSMEDAFIALASATGVPPVNGPAGPGEESFAPPPFLIANGAGDRAAPAVQVSDLTRKFGSFIAVDRVSFEVRRGEIFGFLGPNGAGKSTTIRMLCGILAPTSGSGWVLGLDIARDVEKLKPRLGYMSQRFSLYKDLTVEENVDFYARLYSVAGRQEQSRKDWVLDMAGLADKKNTLAGQLAGGWKQRLALMAAFIHGPEIVFLDEPTSGMDPLSRRRCWAFLNNIANLGITVFVSTHYMDEAEYCQKLGLLYDGKLAALGTPAALKAELGKPHATVEDVFVSLAEGTR